MPACADWAARRARAWVAVVAMCLAAPAVAAGTDAGPAATGNEGDEGTIIVRARLTDHNPFVAGARRTQFPATTFFNGRRLRVDFAGPRGERGALLFDGDTGRGWLVHLDGGIALPLDAAAVRAFTSLRIGDQDPCARLAPRCEPARPRFVAGHARPGYRFRDAGGRGPGGLSDGEFWVDGDLGVVVAYQASGRGARDAPEMEAEFLLVDSITPSYFDLPESVTAYDGPPPTARVD